MILPAAQTTSSAMLLASTIIANAVNPQFLTADSIPNSFYAEQRVIHGRVEQVIDGDTVRVSHCPEYPICPQRDPRKRSKNIKETTIIVRAYGVDSPELQKRDSDPPSQPFAREAKGYTTALVLDQPVEVKLFSRDQYGRVLGKVQTGSRRLDLSVALTQRGLATVYTGQGAVYDNNKALLEASEESAQQRKVGIWSLGKDVTSPGDFKRQHQQRRDDGPVPIR